MSQPIDEAGYERIRRLVNPDLTAPNQWEYLELQEADGTIVWRGSTLGEWTTADTDQIQELQISVSGQDVVDYGTALPVTIEQSVLKDGDADADDELALDGFTEATIAETDDTIVITHQVEVPEL